MAFALEIHSASGRRYVVPVPAGGLRIGKGLQNDLLLFDPDLAETEGRVEKGKNTVLWIPADGSPPADCRRKAVRLGSFTLRARRNFKAWRVVLLSFAVGTAGAWWAAQSESGTAPEKSPAAADIVLPARGAYGRLSENNAADSVRFRFDRAGANGAILHYTPGNVAADGELLVELNGAPVGFAPPCPGRWEIEQRIVLPTERLKFGANRIDFSRPASREKVRWGVRDVYVTDLPAERAAAEDGRSLYAAAEKMFGEGASDPVRLLGARRLIDRAVGRFQVSEGSVPRKAVLLRKKILEARDRLISEWVSQAGGAAGLGDFARAREIYERLLAELVEPADPQRAEISRLMSELP